MPETRRKRKECRKTEDVTYVKGQIVYCFWKGIWWPGAVENVLNNDVYQISFWNEEEMITCNSHNLRDFDTADLIDSSLRKLKRHADLKEKYLVDIDHATSLSKKKLTAPCTLSKRDPTVVFAETPLATDEQQQEMAPPHTLSKQDPTVMCTETPIVTDEQQQEMAPPHTLSKQDPTVMCTETPIVTDEQQQEMSPPHTLSKQDSTVMCTETPLATNEQQQEMTPPHTLSKQDSTVMCTDTPLATNEQQQEMTPPHTLSKQDSTVMCTDTPLATNEQQQEMTPPHTLSKQDPTVMCTETPLATNEQQQEMSPPHTLSKQDSTVMCTETPLATNEQQQEMSPPHTLSKQDSTVMCTETPLATNEQQQEMTPPHTLSKQDSTVMCTEIPIVTDEQEQEMVPPHTLSKQDLIHVVVCTETPLAIDEQQQEMAPPHTLSMHDLRAVCGETPFTHEHYVEPSLPTSSTISVPDEKLLKDLLECVNFSSDENEDWNDEKDQDSDFIPSDSDFSDSDDQKISSSTSVKGVKRKRFEDDMLTISSTTKCGMDRDIVENSDSDMSDEIPYLPPLGPLSNPQSNESDESCVESDNDIVEEEINRDTTYPQIFIRKIILSKTTKCGKFKKSDRVYNTRHFCPFCEKCVSNFVQHINSKIHSKEPEVVKLKTLVDKERKKKISILRNKGDHIQNEKTLSKKRGEIVLARRIGPDEHLDISQYGPCPSCLEWLKLDILYRHQSKCPGSTADSGHLSKGNIMVQSAMIAGRLTDSACKTLVKEVYPIMQDDKIGCEAKNDNLIIALGNHWFKRNVGNKLMRKHYVSAVMRLTSRLLIEIRKFTESEQRLEFYLQPKYFSEVAHAALKVAKQDDDNDDNLEAPSNAIKLGYHLKRLCNLKLGFAIREGNDDQRRASKNFLKLMELEWSSKLARVNLEERRRNKKVELPLPSDVKKLSEFLKSEIESFDKGNLAYENFKKGATLAEAALITYNRRRPGEVQAMRLIDYQNRKTGIDLGVGEEIVKSLTEFERKLVEEQDMIEIRGKCGKCVPVIIPKHVREVLAYLCNQRVRAAAGIPSSSIYIFATNRAGVLRGYDSVQHVTQCADLQYPERIRGTNMRRLMATLCQALDVTPQQQKWIVDHMGHTLDIHNIHYRCTSDIIERSDVAKLLILMDRKQMGYFKNKKLEEISLQELIEEPDKPNEDENEDENEEKAFERQDENEEEAFEGQDEFIPDLLGEEEEEELSFEKRSVKKKKTKSFTRKKWMAAEEEEIRKRFADFLAHDKCPGQKDVEKVMAKSKKYGGLLHARPRDNIKKKVSCMLVKARKNKDV